MFQDLMVYSSSSSTRYRIQDTAAVPVVYFVTGSRKQRMGRWAVDYHMYVACTVESKTTVRGCVTSHERDPPVEVRNGG